MPPASMERVERVKAKTEAVTYAEAERNALKLYAYMLAHTEAGNSILVRDKTGTSARLSFPAADSAASPSTESVSRPLPVPEPACSQHHP
jgi:hypothetical protein